jgi:ATPase subunit of ABC transporter with duplicated ATPase domains
VSGIVVSELAYAHPGGEPLFVDVGFTVAPGEHAALVGTNGTGKTTLLRILAGELTPEAGSFALGGRALYMPQDVGTAARGATVRDMLVAAAPPALRAAGTRMLAAERALAGDHPAPVPAAATAADPSGGADGPGMALARAIADWSDLGGYELEQRWDAAAQRVLGAGLAAVGERPAVTLSGGERKRLVLTVLFASDADILLLDEPDNYLDIPARAWLERELRASRKTVLLISHDRTMLAEVATKIVTLESSAAWVHGGSYASYPEARERRQERLGAALDRWNEEERRLYRYMKLMKQRAALNDGNAPRANAAETRWKRFVAEGPPPPPTPDQHIKVGLRGADSARRVIRLVDLAVDSMFEPFSDDIFFGERIGLVGSNGTGKTHLLDALAAPGDGHRGTVAYGPRTSVGRFTQINDRPDFRGRLLLDIVLERVGERERSMKALARYGLVEAARREFESLSGGQKARLEILCLDLEGHNVLLLDEPTDNLDVDSAAALERALDGFEGTVVAVSHDRAFLSRMSRFLLIADDGAVFELPDFDVAMNALARPDDIYEVTLAKPLS